MRPEGPLHLDQVMSSGPVVLVDAGVVRDMAVGLTGIWEPSAESDEQRAAAVVAASRVRLYGDRDRSGWTLLTTRAASESALKRGDADWSVGMIPVVDDFEEAPARADIESLVQLYRKQEGIDAESATTLAVAVLFEPISIVITRITRALRHGRAGDLPARLDIIDPAEAVERLEIASGETPLVSLPVGSMLERADPWWVPR